MAYFSRPPLWAIPGNHEYISAGKGFFKKLIQPKTRLGDIKNKNPQEASFFCLENKARKLQIIALDTG